MIPDPSDVTAPRAPAVDASSLPLGVRTDRIGSTPGPATVRRLSGVGVAADWGDPGLLVPFVDRAGPSVPQEAEVWYGAHPRHPSTVQDPRADRGAGRAADTLPARERPPFLVKLLAAGAPLSIQVHPDATAARRSWDADESAGIPRDARDRRSADPHAKPELVRALGPFRALCGFRPASRSRALLTAVAPTGAEQLLELLAHGDAGLGGAVAAMLRADRAMRTRLLDAVVHGAQELVAGDDADVAVVRLARLAIDLAARFPGDAGVLVALLLEDVELVPGEALYVAPGTPHAYLSGLAVEVMAPSDNVLRGGMTTKHVDVDAFLDVLDTRAVGAPRIGMLARSADRLGPTGWHRHVAPTDAFLVDEVRLAGAVRVGRSGRGPGVLLCLEGRVDVAAADGSGSELGPGGAVLLDDGLDPVEVRGDGLVLHVSPGARVLTNG